MWHTKLFRFKTAKDAPRAAARMRQWIERNAHRYQCEEIIVNNAYGVTYRRLRTVA